MQNENLKMIAFGTKGDDGIDDGIHLRWSFNDKLGFPSCFKLYRRESDFKNKYEFPLGYDTIPPTIEIPFTFQPNPYDKFKFRIDSVKTNEQEISSLTLETETLEDGSVVRTLKFNGEITLVFSKPVSRIELVFVVEGSSDFKIKMLSDQDDYYHYHIGNEGPGLQNLSFDAPNATGLVLQGKGIKLVWLAAWSCNKGNGWERINEKCGCGLPVNQEGTNYVNEVYPDIIGRDLATALCRLGYFTVLNSPITRLGFLELKGMLLTMLDEGIGVPVGWTLFPNEADASEEEETEASESLEFSKYDFLLIQSLQVFFAKILDLYFVDTEADIGKTYDYKITAKWPEENKRRLDHEITFESYEVGETLFQQGRLDKNTVLTATSKPEIVEAPYELFRTLQGVTISTQNKVFILSFLRPATEVQLVLIHPNFASGSEIVVEGYQHLFSTYVDREVLTGERGILRLRAEQIDFIKIHAPEVTICRIHYDFEPYPIDLQEYVVCGVFKHTHLPLSTPTELVASFLPGGTHNDQDGNVTEKPYMAGLRWEVNEDSEKELISIAPVLYHIDREPNGGVLELLTREAPLFISPSIIEENERNIPIGWPAVRLYYTDVISLDTQNDYRIAALDLFGRQSAFTDPETYEVTMPRPPHPTNVTAKFLDFSTYNEADDTFIDTTLNTKDKNWLRDNGKNAIVVRWKWPENLQLDAPDVEGFNVYFKQGWLNTFTGMVATNPTEEIVTKTSLNLTAKELEKYKIFDEHPEDIPVYRFQISLDVYPPPLPEPLPMKKSASARPLLPEDAFRLCWLSQGNHSFLILKNDGGPPVSLWALKLEDIPLKDKGFGLAITPEKDFFIDYKNPQYWTDNRITHRERKDTREKYTIYIEDPAFPNPTIEGSDTNKVRYAQIGVNSLVGDREGSVSSPATIMALYWDAPATPTAFAPIAGDEILALKAGPANIHGKSAFILTWNDTGSGLKYYIYRALDETLFKVDNALRPNRSTSLYTNFKNDYDFDASDVDVIKNIPHDPNPVLVGSHYAALTPGQLQILACLPDNVGAYSKINEGEIVENELSYIDNTLNGQSNNRYFYALRSVDTNGLQSMMSLATPPVEIPKTTPPPVPVITAVNGGENKVIAKWAKNPGASIAGYLVYRTQDPKKAKDARKMELIKTDETDIFTVVINGSLPDKEFEFEDTSAIARQAYYYGVVAVGLNDESKWLPSRISRAVVGQAYRITPPDPPTISLIEWIKIDDDDNEYDFDEAIPSGDIRYSAVKLEWTSPDPGLMCMVQFSGDYFEGFQNASEWLAPGEFSFIHQNSYFNFDYDYRILVKDDLGNINTDFLESSLTAKIN